MLSLTVSSIMSVIQRNKMRKRKKEEGSRLRTLREERQKVKSLRMMMIRGCIDSKVKVLLHLEVREDHLLKGHPHNSLKDHQEKDLLEKVLQGPNQEDLLHQVKANHLHKANLLHKEDQNPKRWILMMTHRTQMLDLHPDLRKVHLHLKAKDHKVQVQISLHPKEKVHLHSKGDS